MSDKSKQVKCVEYWLSKGYNEEEAKQLISKSQKTFSLEACIKKYGLEEGIKRFEKRQDKWLRSLRQNFSKYGDGRSNSSEFAYDIIGLFSPVVLGLISILFLIDLLNICKCSS